MITVPAHEEVWSWVGSLRRSHHHRGDGRRIVTFVTLPSMLLLLFSEYNTCHQGQVGNPCATTFVPHSKVLVPLWFQAQLTSSRVNSCRSGMTVAVMVTQATPWRGTRSFLHCLGLPAKYKPSFTIQNQRRQPGHLREIYITAKNALNGVAPMLRTWSNERSGGRLKGTVQVPGNYHHHCIYTSLWNG